MWGTIESVFNNIINNYGLLGVFIVFILSIIGLFLYKNGFIYEYKEKNKLEIKTSTFLKSIASNSDYIDDDSIVSFSKKEENRIIRKKLLGISNDKIQHQAILILNNHPDGYESMRFFKKFDKYLILNDKKITLDKNIVRKDKNIAMLLLLESIIIFWGSVFTIYREEFISTILFLIFAFATYLISLVVSPPTKLEIKIFEDYVTQYYEQ